MAKDSFHTLYQEAKRSVTAIVRRFVDNSVDVEDIVQEAYLKSLERSEQGKIDNPHAYIHQTARNLALNHLRAAGYRKHVEFLEQELSDELEDSPTTERRVEVDRRFHSYCKAVSELPTKCRRVYTLRHVYGYSQREVAAFLKISEKTVEYHVAQGLLRVQQSLVNKSAQSVGRDTVRRFTKKASAPRD
jgi:RNA polymerase sigma-70 factor (ECF subfamily)